MKKITIDNMTLRQAQQVVAMEEKAAGIQSDRHEAILTDCTLVSMPYYKYVLIKNELFAVIEADVAKPPLITRLQTHSRLYDVTPNLEQLIDILDADQFEQLSACFGKDYIFNLSRIIAMMSCPAFKREDEIQFTIDQVSEDILHAKFIDCWNVAANFVYSAVVEIPFIERLQNLRMKLKMKPEPADLIEKDGMLVCIINE